MRNVNLKPVVLACAALWGAMICSAASADDITPTPGSGYSNDRDQALGVTCLRSSPPTATRDPQGATIEVIRMAELEDQLNIKSLGNHIESDAFNSDLNNQITSKLSTDDLSATIVYGSEWDFGYTRYNFPKAGGFLNNRGTNAIQQGADYFRTVCGDSFVTTLHQSTYFYLIYQFHFLTTTDAQNFGPIQGMFNNFSSFTQSMQDAINQNHIKGNIQILGYQVGGEPQYLNNIVHGTATTTCDLSDLLACNPVVSSVINYFYGNTGTNYGNQFNDMGPDGQIPVNAAVIEVNQLSYEGLGPQFKSNSQLTPEITAMRDKLGALLETTQNYLQRAKYLQSTLPYSYNYQVFQQNLATQVDNLDDNADLLQDAGANCFNDLSSCIDTANTNMNQLKPIKKAAFIAPTTLDVMTTVSGQPTTEQLFVAVDTTNPHDQTFRGNQINSTPGAMPSDEIISIPDSQIYITQKQNGAITAIYNGVLDSTNHYSGTVNYPDGRQGTWTAVLTPADTGTE